MTRHDRTTATPKRAARMVLWLPGLLVALGAAVATAHGLYEVARAADTPPAIAGLYPLITDGLALVAYAATARLTGRGRRYAWTVVVLAAGLSGLAQASYLARGAVSTSTVLRFGIGAWPAVAAAIVAHLLFLIAHVDTARAEAAGVADHVEQAAIPYAEEPVTGRTDESKRPVAEGPGVQPLDVQPLDVVQAPARSVQPTDPVQPPVQSQPVQTEPEDSVQAPPDLPETAVESPPVQGPAASNGSPVRERARHAALRHQARHGELPTVTQLMSLADVARGTAGTALKQLREQPRELHLIHDDTHRETQP